MQGLHLTADLYGCVCEAALLIDSDRIAALCRSGVQSAGLTLVDETYFAFPAIQNSPGGVTGAVLLAESHLAVHTWPERQAVTLDVYVCNFSTDNSARARKLLALLIEAFGPRSKSLKELQRGDERTARDQVPSTLLEWLNGDSVYGYRTQRLVEATRSAHQSIEVHDTPQWGRLFRLDGSFMTSERDEFHYHESLVHPAAICHPAPRSVLIIGGGDGGSTEELLKHPSVSRVVMAELDPEVIRIAREHLQSVHRGALDDPRVDIRIGDGWETVQAILRGGIERFDLVILDLTDPDTPAFKLYTPEFFQLSRRLLHAGGALILHIGSPVFNPERVRFLIGELSKAYRLVRPMGLYVPLYGAYWGLAVASDQLDPPSLTESEVERRLIERGIGELEFYNGATHRALFSLPNYYRRLLP